MAFLGTRNELTTVLLGTKSVYATLIFFSCIINVLMIAPAIYMLQIYDRVLASQNLTTLLMLTLLMIGIYLLIAILEAVRGLAMIRIGNRLEQQLNQRVFGAAFERNLQQGRGTPAQALSDLTCVRQFLAGNSLFAFFDAPWTPLYLGVAFLIHPILGWLTLFGSSLLFILAVLTEILTNKPLAQANKLAMAGSALVNDQLRNGEAIVAMGMLSALRQHWLVLQRQVLGLQTIASDRAVFVNSISRLVRVLLQSLALGAGALLVLEGEITAGMMIASSIILGRALAPVELLISSWKPLLQFRGAWQRLSSLLNDHPAPPPQVSLPRPQGNLAVEGLFATAPGGGPPILRNFNFRLAAGEVLGIIGPSACGKSTLARLLMGVWAPQSGTVRLDGADIYQWDKAELGSSLGYLPQEVELFDGTVAQNIARFGEINSEALVAAAQLAGVHEMILRFPLGYQTPLGVNGCLLSGGQKQRIGLARALYGDPAFIVLDEPNASLDDVGEAALIQAIQRFKQKGHTLVLITHRPTILGVVDKVLLLGDGVMKAFGNRDEVFAALREASMLRMHSSGMTAVSEGIAAGSTRAESDSQPKRMSYGEPS